MKAKRTSVPMDSVYPFTGLDTTAPSTMKKPSFSPRCKNVVFASGLLEKRNGLSTGYGNMSVLLPAPTLETNIIDLPCWESGVLGTWGGITFSVVGTAGSAITKVWRIDATNIATNTTVIPYVRSIWHWSYDVNDLREPPAITEYPEAQATVRDWLGLNVSLLPNEVRSFIGLEPSDAVLDQFSFVKVITFRDVNGTERVIGLSTGRQFLRSSDTWLDISYRGDDEWDGGEVDIITTAVATTDEGKFLLITNGKNRPLVYSGLTSTFVQWLPNYPDFLTCRALTTYNNHVLIGGIKTVAGFDHQQRIAWSSIGSMNEWLSSEGGAGETELVELNGDIRELVPFQDRMAIYATHSIILMTYVGGEMIYSFSKAVDQTTMLWPAAVVDLGSVHLYLTGQDIRMFDGTAVTRVLSQRVRSEIMAIDPAYAHRVFSFHQPEKNRIFWGLPTGAANTEIYLLEYDLANIEQSTWTKYMTLDRAISMCYVQYEDFVSWDTLNADYAGKTWGELTGTATWLSAMPTVMDDFYGLVMADKVLVLDTDETTDEGEAFVASWESVDLTVPAKYQSSRGRWLEIEFEASGTSLDVSYSIDEGQTFTPIVTKALTSAFAYYTIPIDVNAEKLRVKLSQETNGTFKVRQLRVWVRDNGVR